MKFSSIYPFLHNQGTTQQQDTRFSDKEKKLLKQMKFGDVLNKRVDMSKVKLDVLRPWISQKITEILHIEDDVVVEFVYNQLEEEKYPCPKKMQINMTGFLNGKNARVFMDELWALLISAQESGTGIPADFINAKKEEILKRDDNRRSRSRHKDRSESPDPAKEFIRRNREQARAIDRRDKSPISKPATSIIAENGGNNGREESRDRRDRSEEKAVDGDDRKKSRDREDRRDRRRSRSRSGDRRRRSRSSSRRRSGDRRRRGDSRKREGSRKRNSSRNRDDSRRRADSKKRNDSRDRENSPKREEPRRRDESRKRDHSRERSPSRKRDESPKRDDSRKRQENPRRRDDTRDRSSEKKELNGNKDVKKISKVQEKLLEIASMPMPEQSPEKSRPSKSPEKKRRSTSRKSFSRSR